MPEPSTSRTRGRTRSRTWSLRFRLTATAELDPAFNFGRGFVELGGPDIDGFTGVEIDGSGRIVAGGTLGGATPGTGDQHVVRLLSE